MIRDRDVRLSILKRTRKGRRLWLNRVTVFLSPLWLLPELVYCAGITLFLLSMMPADIAVFSIRGLLPIMVLATILVACRLLVHITRLFNALTCLKRRTFIVEDLVAGPVMLIGWFVFLGVLWVAPVRGAFSALLWGGAG